jgi:hypothetical protein
LRDAHFSLVESVPAPPSTHTATGSGILTLHPLAISWSEVADPPLDPGRFEFTSLAGADYSRVTFAPGTGPWHSTPSTWVLSNPTVWPTLLLPRLLGSPSLNHQATWHVQADSTNPASTVDLWVRQSDGYPLKLVTVDPDGTSFVYIFSSFNSGATIRAPY